VTLRKSRQRDSIRALLLASERPLDCDELLAQAQARIPTIGRSTIYRVLRQLTEMAVIEIVIGPGQRLYYEPAGQTRHLYYEPAGQTRHPHGFCRQCQRAFCVREALEVRHMVPANFILEDELVYLYGQCGMCR